MCSALSQDEQDDAQLKIEDILQMVSIEMFYFLWTDGLFTELIKSK